MTLTFQKENFFLFRQILLLKNFAMSRKMFSFAKMFDFPHLLKSSSFLQPIFKDKQGNRIKSTKPKRETS